MLEGKNIRLRVMENEDLNFHVELINNIDALGEYFPIMQLSKAQAQKRWENPTPFEKVTEWTRFVVEKKDGTKIGFIVHYLSQPGRRMEIGYALVPSERGKGYCTEAVKIMVDYLFLARDIVRVQANTDLRNVASQKVLEKAGFKREGTLRKGFFIRGEWRDGYLYSILREEWREPKILTKTASRN